MRPMILPADRGDSEPPHFDGPEQTMDGTAWSYSGTAPTFGVANFLPQLSTSPDSGGALPTFRLARPLPSNRVPITPGDEVLGLPEHAALQFQLPVMEPVRIPKSNPAPTGLRSGRNRDRRAS